MLSGAFLHLGPGTTLWTRCALHRLGAVR
jgi:hypothetical protein